MTIPEDSKVNKEIDDIKEQAVINNEQHDFEVTKDKHGKVQKIPRKFDKHFQPKPSDLGKVVLPGKNNAKVRKAFELCVKYDGDLARAAEEAGYAPKLVENPSRLLKTKAWGILMEHYFPTYLLFEEDRKLLQEGENVDKHKSLDRIHKLKGNFNRAVEAKINPTGEISQKSNEELQRIIDGDIELDEIGEDSVIDQD